MSLRRLVTRSLIHYWSTGLVVVLGLGISTTVITGSLVIGDSVEGSLREVALARLGSIEYALTTSRRFRAALADDISRCADGVAVAALLSARGSATAQTTGIVTPDVAVWGIDEGFWMLHPSVTAPPELVGRRCAINRALADELAVGEGDALLVTVGRRGAGAGTLFARRARRDAAPSMRIEIAAVLPGGGGADFRLDAQNAIPRNIFIDRAWLAARLDLADVADAIVIAGATSNTVASGVVADAITGTLTLDDHGLQLAVDAASDHLVLSTDAMTLNATEIEAARAAAEDIGAVALISSIYLINEVRNRRSGLTISYAMAAGLDETWGFEPIDGASSVPTDEDILLNEWAAADLDARPGDELLLSYMLPTEEGSYPIEETAGRVGGIVAMTGPGAAPSLVPEFRGITDAEHIGGWDTPFPVDYSAVSERDEEYWERYRAAPKLFLDIDGLRAIWQSAPGGESADWITSVRIRPKDQPADEVFGAEYTEQLLSRLGMTQTAIALRPVRALALEASRGTSDFSQLFLGLSMFLFFAGAGLGGALLRLSVDRRASQAGIMLATGCPESMVQRALVAEGYLLAVLGALVGVPGGVIYAAGVIAALERWWAGALGATSTLWLHVDGLSLVIGSAAGAGVGAAVSILSTRGLVRLSALRLLHGWRGISATPARDAPKAARVIMVVALAIVCVLGIVSLGDGPAEPTVAFFGLGACLLAGTLAGVRLALHHARRFAGATGALPRLAIRNIATGGSRSLLVVALLACATFVIVAVAANGRDPSRMDTSNPTSGSGGFELLATSSVPLPYDPGTAAGRANLGFLPEDESILDGSVIISLPAGPGEDISCLNIARPSHPRILGVPDQMIERGGFAFALRDVDEPWRLLLETRDGQIAAIGDAASVQWTLHLRAGDTYEMRTPAGDALLRFAGLLRGSIFQSELLVSEADFRRLYPDITSPSYLLIDTPAGRTEEVRQVLMERLGELGLQVRDTGEVLNGYMRVQNTYLSMFLALGGLGLLLGTIGLVAVLLRGAFERRAEFALMLATGFSVAGVRALLLLENGVLLVSGLIVGTLCALVAVAPHLASAEAEVNSVFLGGVLSGIILFGIVICAVAVSAAVSGRLIAALRAE